MRILDLERKEPMMRADIRKAKPFILSFLNGSEFEKDPVGKTIGRAGRTANTFSASQIIGE